MADRRKDFPCYTGPSPPLPASHTCTDTITNRLGGRYLNHGGGGLLCHVVDGILVPQPVRALHGVIEVPPPVVLLHVPQSGIDSSLETNTEHT